MSATPTTESMIVSTPGTCGGKPRIAGTRIRVQDVAVWTERFGQSPDEICFHHSTLSLSEVHAALSYYYANYQEIRQDIADGEKVVERMMSDNESKPIPSGAGADANSVPSR